MRFDYRKETEPEPRQRGTLMRRALRNDIPQLVAIESADIYEQAVVKTVAGFFRGNSTHLFGATRFGAPGVYVRTGSSHHNEVVWPQSPRTESGQVIPQIVASSSCLPKPPVSFSSLNRLFSGRSVGTDPRRAIPTGFSRRLVPRLIAYQHRVHAPQQVVRRRH